MTSLMKNKMTWGWREQFAILSRIARISYIEKMAFEKRFEKRESVTQAGNWMKSVLGRENSLYKGPETGACLVS